MSLLYMSQRGKNLLNVLLAQSDYISLNNLAKALDVSRRTVYYDIKKVNIWLEFAKLPALKVVREKGIFIPENDRKKIISYLEADDEKRVYVFTPAQRCKGIICYIIYTSKLVYLEQLMQCFEVSRNTIFSDLKTVTKQLEKYELELCYQVKTGYEIKGDPVRIRALFLLYFGEMISLFEDGTFSFFNPDNVMDYYNRLKDIEQKLEVNYVDGVLFSLAALIPNLYRRKHAVVFPGLKATKVQETKEYELVNSYFPELIYEEQCYLALHLLGSRVNTVPTNFFTNPSKQYIYDLVKELVTEFEKVACVIFEEHEELERGLFVHLGTSLYRYQYGIQIGNTLVDDVMKEYPDLFAITRKVVKKLEDSIGAPIPDSEVAYLVLHFGSALKIEDADNKRLRILIVCVNGMSTGNMIKREVQKLLPFAQIVGVCSAQGLMNVQDICDLIITTVKFDSVVPDIVVHPVLTELDRRNILNHKLIAPRKIAIKRDQIFQVVKKYVDPQDFEALKNDISAYLQGGMQEFNIEDKLELGLCKLLDVYRVHVIYEKCIWQQSIRIASQCLVDSKSVEQRYLDTIISQLQYYGPYMFLTDNVILAHAKPEDGVNTLDISIAVFKEPVVFLQDKKASLIIVLAAQDQERHLRILQDILELISNQKALDMLIDSDSSKEAFDVIKQYVKE